MTENNSEALDAAAAAARAQPQQPRLAAVYLGGVELARVGVARVVEIQVIPQKDEFAGVMYQIHVLTNNERKGLKRRVFVAHPLGVAFEIDVVLSSLVLPPQGLDETLKALMESSAE